MCRILTVDLRGRVVVVTGANQGLGLAISHALAERGCTLYMVCRDEDRGKAAVKCVQTATGNKDVNLKLCNLSSKQAIHALASDLSSKNVRIYLLVHNAGVMVRSLLCFTVHVHKYLCMFHRAMRIAALEP